MNKKEFNSNITSIVLLVFIFTGIVISTIYYTKHLNTTFKDETKSYLSEMSLQSASVLKEQLNGNLNSLANLSNFISGISLDQDIILNKLISVSDENELKRIGFILPDGRTYTTDNQTMNLKEREFFKKSMKGIASISDTLIDKIDGKRINVFSVPIKNHDEITGVIFATKSVESCEKNLSISTFDGKGYFYVVKSNGDMVFSSNHPNSKKDIKNIFSYLKDQNIKNHPVFDTVQKNMSQKQSGFLEYTSDNIHKYMNYSPIDINDWYILSIVPASVVSSKTDEIMYRTIAIFIIISCAFLLLLFYNIVIQNRNKDILRKKAYFDDLTGIYTITKFEEDTHKLLHQNSDIKYALIQFDIDKFKFINDMYGFEIGNKFLIYIAQTLTSYLNEKERCARVSNDVFVILMQYESEQQMKQRLEDIYHVIYTFAQKQHIEMLLSFGVYIIIQTDMEISAMIDRAWIAEKTIKGSHQNRIAFYTDKMRDAMLHEKLIENEMIEALENHEFQVYYQPKYAVDSLNLDSAEALIRWQHPQRGLIPPIEFIPVFEKNGFVVKIDTYVFEQVCIALNRWIKEGKKVVPISVNLSRLHLYNFNFIEEYKEIRSKYQIPPNLIELELTESVVMDNVELLQNAVDEIHKAGFLLSMDDFGSGYSSLNLLNDISIDSIKLDREFFNKTANSEKGRSIVSTIIALTKRLNIQTVAEGVETKEQLDFLTKEQCDIAQGYYFSKPIPFDEFNKML